jgi:hypothetical protein
MALALWLAPGVANAESRRHVFKPGQFSADDPTRDAGNGADAPEIDGSTLGLGIALATGGLLLMASRRRSSRV